MLKRLSVLTPTEDASAKVANDVEAALAEGRYHVGLVLVDGTWMIG